MTTPAIPDHAELILPAPAKLNLMLHILGRRADGYHLLQTLFQFLDYGDELGFALRQDGEISESVDAARFASGEVDLAITIPVATLQPGAYLLTFDARGTTRSVRFTVR